jgi:precorrin-2/cobalt-factor-2 C20-methyltransferase
MYLFARLAERFPVVVVPGVASLGAAAAAAQWPLAARLDTLSVLPAALPEPVLLCRLAEAEAVAIIKLGRHFAKVRAVLQRLGLAEAARYVEHASLATQRVLPLDQVNEAEVPYFSMILLHRRGVALR